MSSSMTNHNLDTQQLLNSLRTLVTQLQLNSVVLRASTSPAKLSPKEENAELLKMLLQDKATATVAEVAGELKVSLKTANRLCHALCHAGAAVLVYEPFRTINRLRIYRDAKAYMAAQESAPSSTH